MRLKEKDWELDIRGVHYCVCRARVWIQMPNKKGMIDGKECEFPIVNFKNKEQQRAFVKLLQICFGGFMKSRNYCSFEEWDSVTGAKKKRKAMKFYTPTPRNKQIN